ncbi:DUF6452 family protein [Mangrovibacterium lignilyticum]|uniref:DUF6452 family protein n=1 Tax=Mangrovibacterium lignilyticum TaxID=2668052 RepID=UPI0013D702F9|nr:DUF6452 family protein [Mangrovibacterium lignilyticum]
MKQFFQFIFILLIAAACKEVYDRPPQSQVQLNLYNIGTKGSESTLISARGLQQDSIWIDGQNSSSFLLPLSENGPSTFVVLMDSVADTITLNYNTKLVYESMESGFYYEHYLQSVSCSLNKIDSISLIDTLVISIWHENIQLYLNDSTAYTDAN